MDGNRCCNTKLVTIEELIGKHQCVKCNNSYVQKSSLNRHLRETDCGDNSGRLSYKKLIQEVTHLKETHQDILEQNQTMKNNMKTMNESIVELLSTSRLTHSINDNHVQLMCVEKEDSLCEGDLVLTYIKGCVNPQPLWDCRMIDKFYQHDVSNPSVLINYDNKDRHILVDLLQRSYLSGVNYIAQV